jgi:hypothetical protein
MPIWLEGSQVENISQNEVSMTSLNLHVERFLVKMGERRRLQLFEIQHELSNEAFLDQEELSEGSEVDLNFQEEDEWLKELEDM